MDSLVEAFHNPISAREHGIQFNGASYKCVRADKDSIYAKKVGIKIILPLTEFPGTGGVRIRSSQDELHDYIWYLFLFHVPQRMCGSCRETR